METDELDVIQSGAKAYGGRNPPAPGPGRPKGSVNRTTQAQKAFAARVIGEVGTPEFDEFIASTRKQLLAGVLPPAITALILHYAFGKPKETIEVSGELGVITEVRRVIVPPPEQVIDVPCITH